MATKQSKFLLGLFVTVGVIITVSAIIWVGASQYFQTGVMFVTYFDESVQGLSLDSSVKYRGVNVGTVRSIDVAPDDNLIEVTMKIDMKGGDEKTLTSKLRSAGLTGIVYIELDRRNPEDVDMSPKINFPVEYPLIASRPSDAKLILTTLDKIVSEINKIDLDAFFVELREIEDGVDQFINSPKLKNTMANLESASGHLDRTLKNLDKLALDGKLRDVLTETHGSIVDMRALIGQIREDFQQAQLADIAGKTNKVVSQVDQNVREISYDLKITADNLQRASENLDIVMDRLRHDPSELLFGVQQPASLRER